MVVESVDSALMDLTRSNKNEMEGKKQNNYKMFERKYMQLN